MSVCVIVIERDSTSGCFSLQFKNDSSNSCVARHCNTSTRSFPSLNCPLSTPLLLNFFWSKPLDVIETHMPSPGQSEFKACKY